MNFERFDKEKGSIEFSNNFYTKIVFDNNKVLVFKNKDNVSHGKSGDRIFIENGKIKKDELETKKMKEEIEKLQNEIFE